MNHLRCEDIVEAMLVAAATVAAAVAAAAAAAAAVAAYGVGAKIALKLPSIAMQAIERESVVVGMVATL
jgi:hypothetical protein